MRRTGGETACVLVVDDEDDIREALREAVEMIGRTAMTAANGEEALRLLETQRPCLVLLDLAMPVMSGREMLEEMRRRPELAPLPVVVSTSTPAQAPPGVPVLPKPIAVERLFDLVRRSCRCR